jgi:hypothetical protein
MEDGPVLPDLVEGKHGLRVEARVEFVRLSQRKREGFF